MAESNRRKTRVVWVGQIAVGGSHPIRVQSMCTAHTTDTQGVMREMEQLVEAKCEIVRVTVPTQADCDNLPNIRAEMKKRGIHVPLVADIHFTPSIAMKCVEYVDKVRINPGNFVDKKKFKIIEYTNQEYQMELEKIREKFAPLVLKCKEYGIAMRIGTNHGSLSDRILNRYGDTPEGMVESALEFLRICRDHDYHDIILSMKASNVQVMTAAYRLLAHCLDELGWDYPFHLGVTEAGEGEDGRIKSAIGIGSLLEDGIGDTIRVSLTEDPVNEVPVAYELVGKYQSLKSPSFSLLQRGEGFKYSRRFSRSFKIGELEQGGLHPIRVWVSSSDLASIDVGSYHREDFPLEGIEMSVDRGSQIADCGSLFAIRKPQLKGLPLALKTQDVAQAIKEFHSFSKITAVVSDESEIQLWKEIVQKCCKYQKALEWNFHPQNLENINGFVRESSRFCNEFGLENYLYSIESDDTVYSYRFLAQALTQNNIKAPIHLRYQISKGQEALLAASVNLGSVLLNGIGDSLQIGGTGLNPILAAYNILQACRLRISKAEYISCPSCGRTLFDLQSTSKKIREATSHLKGVKIGIMGCIVNGPGEMADADFGYVGTGPGRISLYVQKECVKRNIPEDEAVTSLIELIKGHGRWVDVS